MQIADGCLVKICNPRWATTPLEKKQWFCRKGYYAFNMLGVCDHRKKFIYASVRHAGTFHDSVGYNFSQLKRHMEEIHNPRRPRYLISDEGVNCQKTMLTAYRRDRGRSQVKSYSFSICS